MGLFTKTPKEVEVVPEVDEAVVETPVEEEVLEAEVDHNTNNAAELVEASNDEANNPTVQGPDHSDPELQRQENETAAEYNERIPVAIQPVQPGPTHSYLGEEL